MTDLAILAPLALKTKSELRYFDLVTLKFMGRSKKVYMCVGKHAVFFLQRNMSKLIRGGQLFFAHVEKLVEDTNSTEFLLILSKDRPPEWQSEKLFVSSLNREALVDFIMVAWQTDYMFRFGKVCVFPRFKHPLMEEGRQQELPRVKPFEGYKEVRYEGYSLFLKQSFMDRANAVSAKDTGMYLDSERGIYVSLHVHDPLPLYHLEEIQRDHIRWVAMEYKQALTENMKHFFVVKNNAYYKKMNLADDISTWMGWELFLQCREPHNDVSIFCVLLRRQHIPPLMDTAQDFAIVFRVDNSNIRDGFVQDEDLVNECRLAADLFATLTQEHVWYRDMVEAKLNALLFNEEGFQWLSTRLKLQPSVADKARVFLKSILKIMENENVLTTPELLTVDLDGVPVVSDPLVVKDDIVRSGEELGLDPHDETEDMEIYRNEWVMRVARYLAYAVDGGLLGGKFSLADVCDSVGAVGTEADKKLRQVLDFLLHLRPRDMLKPFYSTSLVKAVKEATFGTDYCFNDSVLTVMLESQYVQKLFHKSSADGGYANLLAVLLNSPCSSSLKAAICRQVLHQSQQNVSQEYLSVITPALVGLMRTATPLLATYATAALTNLSAANDAIKNVLISSGAAQSCVENLRSKEDDLIQYTLTLLVNLTKSVHHRAACCAAGLIPITIDILTSTYNQMHKHKTLTHLSSLIGQLGNDESSRVLLSKRGYPTIECLLYMFQNSKPSAPLKGKVLFALRQLCTNDWQTKQRVGKFVIKTLIADLRETTSSDFTLNGLYLLQTLATYKENCVEMNAANIKECLEYLSQAQSLDIVIEKIRDLNHRINQQTRAEFYQ
ncbi:unnamed protein product [Vitrella brassicaformis CCMP3155]|uniref:Uncharacterized protein n=2 Tax=Vitrella brassicaformis TaxID=1169539 RepID=A0A0G4F3I4_VITBC|nr:unnamed protein product [Vitrella brassicaformis CCMP3155]|eukprot:CEM06759.1 unnamed protein product [Vitrella brassicaformis CCMP3155]